MKRMLAIVVGAVMCAGAAQDAPPKAGTSPAPDKPQPAGDAVSPKAGEHKSPADAPGGTPGGKAGAAPAGGVRTLRLPELQYELPPGPGQKTVVVMCATCHTTRYIMIQPPLSRETWTAEVTKMQKTFGAPIPDDKTAEIVEYLLAVRGQQGK